MLKKSVRFIFRKSTRWLVPWPAQREALRDGIQGLFSDPGNQNAIDACLDWILEAQRNSASQDGGVARHFSLITGWSASYPETTGYIIPTVMEHARRKNCPHLNEAAKKMMDWLLSIQMPDGAFRGSHMHAEVIAPVVFDTGQILQGLAAAATTFGEPYLSAMKRASQWLMKVQDPDGAWRHPNPFAAPGDHVWETHVAWGLLEASRVSGDSSFGEAGLRNIRWAVTRQLENGWYQDCGLGNDHTSPLTHTLAYTLRGIVEGYRFSSDPALLKAATQTADGLLSALTPDGSLPGMLNAQWKPTVPWVCLTGLSQTAICWFMLYQFTNQEKYLKAARRANQFVRRTLHLEGPSMLRGGVKGSFPVNGDYCRFQLINWACKFLIDACTLEEDMKGLTPSPSKT